MYVRFVVHRRDKHSGRRLGVFQALYGLRNAGHLSEAEEAAFTALARWFNEQLPEPSRLARSRNSRAKNVAISWFKESATEHIQRMRDLVALLEAHGVAVEAIHTDRPGYIVYEDEHQIAAEPFRDTPT